MKKAQLISNLRARVRELEDLFLEATGKEAPPSSFDIDQAQSKAPARRAIVCDEEMAALTHPIIK